ncbi:hypothetical protein [Mycetocola zhadangensis]|nr:hypothetical protein [Mycetocola zhadangensis]
MRLALDPEAGSKAIEQLGRFNMVTKPLTVDEIIWSAAPHA